MYYNRNNNVPIRSAEPARIAVEWYIIIISYDTYDNNKLDFEVFIENLKKVTDYA